MSRVLGLATIDLVSPRWLAYAALAPQAGAPSSIVERRLEHDHHLFVAFDVRGLPEGVLVVKANRHGTPDSLHVVVHPERRRRGIASALFRRAQEAGVEVEQLSGRGGLTPDGENFQQGRGATS